MKNVVWWEETELLDATQATNWLTNLPFSPRWMSEQVVRLLDQYQISNYKVIVSEHSKLKCADYISNLNEQYIIVINTDHLYHNNFLRYVKFTPNNQYTIPFLVSDTVLNFVSTAEQNPNKTILFCSLVANLSREISQIALPNNLIFKGLGLGTLGHKASQYTNSPVVTTKSPDAKTFICLNNVNRPHRTAAVTYLLASDLDQYGYVSCIGWNNDPTVGCFLDWCFDTVHNHVKSEIRKGITKFDHSKLLNLPYYKDYLNNYNQVLAPLYQHTFIDIVTDTTFFEPSEFLNDKYVNTILGANFPIFISSSGTVEQLRLLGFDVFDDVIDHSYDTITDHALRLSEAIELNRHLLVDVELTSRLWHTHADRFKHNQQYFVNEFKQVAETILTSGLESSILELIKQN